MASRPTRRKLLQTAVAGSAILPVIPAQQHPHETAVTPSLAAKSAYTPSFFTPAEYVVLEVLVDLIIPRTTTPGASGAGVPEFVDRVALRDQQAGKQIRSGLDWLSGAAHSAYGKRFEELAADQQTDILAPVSSAASEEPGQFFRLMKDLTIDGYYSSREGLMTELGWDANTYMQEFQGCTHPEHWGE